MRDKYEKSLAEMEARIGQVQSDAEEQLTSVREEAEIARQHVASMQAAVHTLQQEKAALLDKLAAESERVGLNDDDKPNVAAEVGLLLLEYLPHGFEMYFLLAFICE